MKTKHSKELILAIALIGITCSEINAAPFGTEFTYQGRLTTGTNVSNGLYDFRFSLWDGAGSGATLIGATQSVRSVSVSNGLFTVDLDFGAGAFNGDARWLELGVRTSGAIGFTELSPRESLTPTPYAIAASNLTGTLPATQLTGTLPASLFSGTYDNAITLNNPANLFAGSGSGLTGVNAVTLGGYDYCGLPCYWKLTGNGGTMAGANFLGTIDNQPLEIKVNSQRAFRFEPNVTSPNLVGGYSGNSALGGIYGVAIAGGGRSGEPNTLEVSLSSIGGGSGNRISLDSIYSTIAGGHDNYIHTNMPGSTINGGRFNSILAGNYSTITGGESNLIGAVSTPYMDESFFHYNNAIVGGSSNRIYDSRYSIIAGGLGNSLIGDHGDEPIYSAIVGGYQNQMYAMGDSDYGGAIIGGISNVLWSGEATISGGRANYVGRQCWDSGIGGGSGNRIEVTAHHASIGGGALNRIPSGSYYTVIGGGFANTNSAAFSAIAGGSNNVINADADHSFVGGGGANMVGASASYSSIVGGYSNVLKPFAYYSSIGGGSQNTLTDSGYSVIGGGEFNMMANSPLSVIAGGYSNTVFGASAASAGGYRAKALHNGAFVWADKTEADFASTGVNQFLVRASGGVGINTATPTATLHVAGDTRVEGLTRAGSQTGTAEVPDKALLTRRIKTTSYTAGSIVARTDTLTLERDGTVGGFRVSYSALPGNVTIACMGVNSSGGTVNFSTSLANPGTAGTITVYLNTQNVVFFRCSFGNNFGPGHQTEVSLTRYPDDYFWAGSLTSTYNQ